VADTAILTVAPPSTAAQTTETTVLPGGQKEPPGGIVSADQTTISGDGTSERPLRAIAGGTSNIVGFEYTVQPGDTDTIVVTLPAERADTNYIAIASGLVLADFLLFQCPPAAYTLTTLVVQCNATPTPGDIIGIVIVQKS